MTRRGALSAYAFVCAGVLLAVTGLSVVLSTLGARRFDEHTFYFYELGDIGHPGLANVVGTMGMLATAVIATVLALLTRRRVWTAVAVLFVVLAIDTLLRIHNHVPGGDVGVRLAYWLAIAWIARELRGTVTFRPLRGLLGAGLLLLVASEVIDILATSEHGRAAVIEETALSLGAWCCALAALGMVLVLFGDAELSPESPSPSVTPPSPPH